MISVQEVVDRMTSALDAEGPDRYLFEQDFKPAINSAIDWLVIVFNAAFAQDKLSEEDLRELTKVKIWQASNFNRIKFDDVVVGHKLWSITGVFPEPTVFPDQQPPPLANDYDSVFFPDLSYVESDHSADLLSIEEWNENKKNIFMAGNTEVSNELKKYAYLGINDYSSSGYPVVGEIEIRPSVAGNFVALSYIKVPDKIDLISDQIEFPQTIFELLYQKALNFVSYKQGDQTTLYSVTERDVVRLAQLMT